MIPAPFEYARPRTLEQALELLSAAGDDAKILAGGHSLLPAMKLRLVQPKLIVDISLTSNRFHYFMNSFLTSFRIPKLSCISYRSI